MYCKNCGAQLPDGTRFCTNCGYSQSEDGPGRAKARNWSLAGILLSVLLWIVYVILILVGVSWATWWDDSIYYTTACLF